jgi:glycine hydroxymethyltransferase
MGKATNVGAEEWIPVGHGGLALFAQHGISKLYDEDPTLAALLEAEYRRQTNVLAMVASSSVADGSVLACEGMMLTNVTAEGYPGKRYHGGCRHIDEIEALAITRAKDLFRAEYANVQVHSASAANQIVMCGLLKPGDTILGMGLESGGHLTHGAKASLSGRYFNAIEYGLNGAGLIDYDQVLQLAVQHRPKLIICGTTSYPRTVDFKAFRAIADRVDALLLADITHIAGLVAAGLHPSPIDDAHFTTLCTHKQLYGPRGGLILIGRDAETLVPGKRHTLAALVQSAVFPLFQGAPAPNNIAAKARALARAATPEFRSLAERIVTDARVLADTLTSLGCRVVSGGTDNHIVMVDVGAQGLTGIAAQLSLEDCNIIVNKNKTPGDTRSPAVTSGIRIGTNSLARRNMGADAMIECAGLLDEVLRSTRTVSDSDYQLDAAAGRAIRSSVADLCRRFPLPYPALSPLYDAMDVAAAGAELP